MTAGDDLKRVAVSACLAVLLLGVAACGSPDSNPHYKVTNTNRNPGIADLNPNLPTSPNYHTYARDTKLVKQAVNQVKGIAQCRVFTNGANMTVYIKPAAGISNARAAELRNIAESNVRQTMPRYIVHVKLWRS